EAIERGWLSPFHYHGIYDDTDYDRVTWLGSHYDESDLYREQIASHMATRVLAVWKTLRGTRTLTFCSSIAQADWFAQTFRRAGVAAASVHSGPRAMDREQAIRAITDGTIAVLFTVDLFNEGVDIPSLDTLLFVRPTESLTVFIQQIGRGLRTCAGKSHCTIIDLIGNYRHADYKLRVFDTRPPSENVTERWAQQIAVPAACEWNLDPRVVDLVRVMASKRSPRKERLREAWLTLQRDLGRSPSYLEFHLYGTVDSQAVRQEYTSWIQFREAMNDLTPDEHDLLERYRGWFSEVESTRMSKSYKMVLLQCMLARGRETWPQPLTPRAAAEPFHAYLSGKPYRQADLEGSAMAHSSAFMEKQISSLIRRMPMTMWAGSSSGWVTMTSEGFAILIDDSPQALSTLYDWTSQICEYRLHVYFERKQGGSGG
ncbi:MAG: helicase-related protein, partial [Firmicutes bacterium]|nr:helicase-related protein [Bacillota bacterium]